MQEQRVSREYGCITYESPLSLSLSLSLSFTSSIVLLSRMFHCRSRPPSLSHSLAAALSNEQPAPGHITPTDKMPPLTVSLPRRAASRPSLAHLPCFRIGVSYRAFPRHPHKKCAHSTEVWHIFFKHSPTRSTSSFLSADAK